MTSLPQLKKDIQEIKAVANPEKIAIAWLEPKDGRVYPNSNKFDDPDRNKSYTPEEFEELKKSEGYTKILFVTWCVGKAFDRLSPEERESVLVKMKMGART